MQIKQKTNCQYRWKVNSQVRIQQRNQRGGYRLGWIFFVLTKKKLDSSVSYVQ